MSGTKEAIDLLDLVGNGSRRRASVPKAGSVWETRMKHDQVHGGIKVFNATPTPTPTPNDIPPPASPPRPHIDANKLNNSANSISNNSKRKTWKSDNSEVSPLPILHITRQRSESIKNSGHQLKDVSVSADEIMKKSRSDEVNDATIQQESEPQQGSNSDSGKIKSEGSDRSPPDQLVTDLGKKVLDNTKKPISYDQHCEDKNPISTNVGRQINTPSDGGEEREKKQIEMKITSQQQRPKKFGLEEKKPIPANRSSFHPIPTKTKPSNNTDAVPKSSGKLQTFVDLVMWKDVSKSSFVFGIGTFAIVSTSFTKDLSISFISVVSYLGLAYLAANFLFRTLVTRGSVEMPEYVVGEEEAIWAMKLILPYVNEFLVNLRALFSGDPATTMKLAVLLFVLAQCGSSITIWKTAKLGFLAVFTVPKICSSYSSQITAYGTFWIHRFLDVWDSCSHKKLVGFVGFTLVWNLASLVARVWIVFMSFVALKYYQQSSMISQGCMSEETSSTKSSSWQKGQHIGGRQRIGSTSPSPSTQKKVC